MNLFVGNGSHFTSHHESHEIFIFENTYCTVMLYARSCEKIKKL